MAPVTGELVFRLQRLQDVFQNITSPGQLQDAMQESGNILAQLLQQPDLKLPADDLDKDQAAAALAEPVPRWDTKPVEHSRLEFWFSYADRYSDSPRTLLHTKPAPRQLAVTRRKGKKVTHTQLPATGVVQETDWTKDFMQQGLRYGLFCTELLAAIQGRVAAGNAGITTEQEDIVKKSTEEQIKCARTATLSQTLADLEHHQQFKQWFKSNKTGTWLKYFKLNVDKQMTPKAAETLRNRIHKYQSKGWTIKLIKAELAKRNKQEVRKAKREADQT